MIVKILIRTPKGRARSAEKKLRPVLLGIKTVKEMYTNKDDNEILWIIEGTPRKIEKITNKVSQFRFLMQALLDNKLVKKTIRKKLSKESEDELLDMLINQTDIEVVKEATARELEKDSQSIFSKIKEKFKL